MTNARRKISESGNKSEIRTWRKGKVKCCGIYIFILNWILKYKTDEMHLFPTDVIYNPVDLLPWFIELSALFHSLQKYMHTSTDDVIMYLKHFYLFFRNVPHFKIIYDSWNVDHPKIDNIFSLILDCELIFRK